MLWACITASGEFLGADGGSAPKPPRYFGNNEVEGLMKVRQATVEDAAGILAVYQPYVLESAVSFETEVPSLDQMVARIEMALGGYEYLVAEDAGAVVGYAYGSAYRPRAAYAATAEVTVYVAQGQHGRGIGRALYDPLIAALQAKGFCSLIGVVTAPNPASEALHKRCGFQHVGRIKDVGRKFDTWHDTDLYQLLLTD